MDDLRAALVPFDADATLAAAPDPWDYLPMPEVRDGPPWAMAEMIAAEPGLVGRDRGSPGHGRRARGRPGRCRRARPPRPDSPWSSPAAGRRSTPRMGAAAILRDAWRSAGLPGRGPVAAQAFELAQEPPAAGLVDRA